MTPKNPEVRPHLQGIVDAAIVASDPHATDGDIKAAVRGVRELANIADEHLNIPDGGKTEAGRVLQDMEQAVVHAIITMRNNIGGIIARRTPRSVSATDGMGLSAAPARVHVEEGVIQLTATQLLAHVREVLVDALGVDDDEVVPEATLMSDLGAESIDFLDINFRLEKQFDVRIPRGDLFPEGIYDESQVQDGRFTEEGLAQLRQYFQHGDFAALEQDPRVENLSDVYTVRAVMKYFAARDDFQIVA